MSTLPDGKHKKMEKYILRKAFDVAEKPYLPEEVLWRQKEQFSDGVGYSWVDGLRDYAEQVPWSFSQTKKRPHLVRYEKATRSLGARHQYFTSQEASSDSTFDLQDCWCFFCFADCDRQEMGQQSSSLPREYTCHQGVLSSAQHLWRTLRFAICTQNCSNGAYFLGDCA